MADKLAAINAYVATFRAEATQLNSIALAGEWFRSGQPVETAITWANAGHTAEEALPLIAQGVTPEMATAGDDALVAEHGIIGAAVLKLQLENPGATVLVEPDADAEI